MRMSGELLCTAETAEAKQILEAAGKKSLPENKEQITLMVEGDYVIIMQSIGFGQYEIRSCYVDRKRK